MFTFIQGSPSDICRTLKNGRLITIRRWNDLNVSYICEGHFCGRGFPQKCSPCDRTGKPKHCLRASTVSLRWGMQVGGLGASWNLPQEIQGIIYVWYHGLWRCLVLKDQILCDLWGFRLPSCTFYNSDARWSWGPVFHENAAGTSP